MYHGEKMGYYIMITLDGKPVIKVYNPTDGNTSIYKQDARNPQISPDGKFMIAYATDALDKTKESCQNFS